MNKVVFCIHYVIAPAPDPPTGLMIVEMVSDTAVTLNWTAPVNTFGDLIANILTCRPEIPDPLLVAVSVNVSGSTTSATVSGLENGARYNCSVEAQNEAGLLSEPSVSLRITAAEAGR